MIRRRWPHSCAPSADPRLEPWLRNDALNRHLSSTATDDFRLLVFHEDAGALVAITAHERNFVVAGPDGEPVPGSYFMVAAITDRFREKDRSYRSQM